MIENNHQSENTQKQNTTKQTTKQTKTNSKTTRQKQQIFPPTHLPMCPLCSPRIKQLNWVTHRDVRLEGQRVHDLIIERHPQLPNDVTFLASCWDGSENTSTFVVNDNRPACIPAPVSQQGQHKCQMIDTHSWTKIKWAHHKYILHAEDEEWQVRYGDPAEGYLDWAAFWWKQVDTGEGDSSSYMYTFLQTMVTWGGATCAAAAIGAYYWLFPTTPSQPTTTPAAQQEEEHHKHE